MNHLSQLQSIIKHGLIQSNISLTNLTTIKIGGLARFLIQTNNINEIIAVQKYCRQNHLCFFIIGGGSNLVFDDTGFDGVILKLKPDSYQILRKKPIVEVKFSAGYSSHLASIKMAELGYSGFESLYGLPGTIGGAIYQNSKWPRGNYQIADNLISVTFLNEHLTEQTRKKSELKFDYGFSSFQKQKSIILSAVFKFTIVDQKIIQRACKQVMDYRHQSQPVGVFTAGCIFKNLKEGSAGYYLDQVGMKNIKVGDLTVSPIHANFFVNLGRGSASDYLQLIQIAKKRVKQQFQLNLKEEVQFVK